MRHYNELSLKMLQLIIEREIISIEKTHDVWAVNIQTEADGGYDNGGHLCEVIVAHVVVNGEGADYELEWDVEEGEITTVTKSNRV